MHFKRQYFYLVFLVMLCKSHLNGECNRNKNRKEMSKTKCVAGRRFFARFDKIPRLASLFTEKSLLQPYVFPWIARVMGFYADRPITCTGSLINDRYILTAQHCVAPPIEAPHLTVSLGYQDNDAPPQTLDRGTPNYVESRVIQIRLHPNYDVSNLQTASNDLALLKIAPVAYTKTIYPIQLPTLADRYFDMSNVVGELAGWQQRVFGYQYGGYSISNIFHKETVQTITNDACGNYNIFYQQAVNPDELCAVSVGSRGDSNQCSSKGGDPLMIENHNRVYNITVLVGVLTWNTPWNSQPCTLLGAPAVFVRVDRKIQWISDNTKDAVYCKY